MVKALRKDAFKEIINTRKRFLSILLIVLLGVGFFAGIWKSFVSQRVECYDSELIA